MSIHRLSYLVYALERLLESCQQCSGVCILYDVACTLKKHLQVGYTLCFSSGCIIITYRNKGGQTYWDSFSFQFQYFTHMDTKLTVRFVYTNK